MTDATDEYLDNPPFLTRGMAAALRHLINTYLFTDAASLLGQDTVNAIGEMVVAKEPLDQERAGLLSESDLFAARVVYWAMQARLVLPEDGIPKPVPAEFKVKRGRRAATVEGLRWIGADGAPVDTLERKDE
jgi:hypothetical protein